MKHTSGPWTITHTLGGDVRVDGDRDDGWVPVATMHQGGEEGEANARLIAEAPVLAYGLQHVVMSDHGYKPNACSACDVSGEALNRALSERTEREKIEDEFLAILVEIGASKDTYNRAKQAIRQDRKKRA